MRERQQPCMQCQTRSPALISNNFTAKRTAIHRITADRISLFRQMNPDLMRPTGFEEAPDNRVFPQGFDRFDVSCCRLAFRFRCSTAAQSVASITDKPGADDSGFRRSRHHRLVNTIDRMLGKLADKTLLSFQ